MTTAAQLRRQIEAALAVRIPAALSPRPLSAPELIPSGLPEVDAALGGGLPRGSIAELTGSGSCGRTTLVLSTLAGLTRQGSRCAYVDLSDALDPLSAAALGVELSRLLWVRMRPEQPVRLSQATRLSQGLRAADLLLSAGGWGAVVVDMAGIDAAQARRIPLAAWYRFRLQAERSRTLLLVVSSALPAVDARAQGAAQSVPQSVPGHLSGHLVSGHLGNCAAIRLHCLPAEVRWQRSVPASPPLLEAMRYRIHFERGRAAASIPPSVPPSVPQKSVASVSAADLSTFNVCTSNACTQNAYTSDIDAAWSSAALWTG